jgi:hypothetical protein
MLWWLIGLWLAGGAVLPAFWLLSMAYRWLASLNIGPKGLHMLSGLAGIGIGALILWFVCLFSDSNIAMRDTPSASAVALASMTHPVVASERLTQLPPLGTLSLSSTQFSAAQFSAAQTGPPSLGEAEQVTSIQPGIGDVIQCAGGDACRQTDGAAPLVSVAVALMIAPLHSQPGVKRDPAHRHTYGPSVPPYVIRSSSHGIWLFAPNGNEGTHN